MFEKEKLTIFKQALSKALRKIMHGTSATTIAASYDISTSIISKVLRGEKDIHLSTFFRIAEAFQTDPAELISMVCKELPEGFMFTEE